MPLFSVTGSDVSNRENKSPNENVDVDVGKGAVDEKKGDPSPQQQTTSMTPTTITGTAGHPNDGSGAATTPVTNTVAASTDGSSSEGFNADVVTHLLCHTQKSDIYKRAIESRKVRCVTAYWLNDVLTHKKMSQVMMRRSSLSSDILI